MRRSSRIQFGVIFFITAFFLNQCGSPTTNLTKQEELRDREQLKLQYHLLVGKYEGLLNVDPPRGDSHPVSMQVFLVEEPNGVNEDGEPRYRPALKARYRREDFGGTGIGDRTLYLRYYAETSEIVGTTPSQANTPGVPPDSQFLSVSGKRISAEKLRLEVRDQRGRLGDVELTRTN